MADSQTLHMKLTSTCLLPCGSLILSLPRKYFFVFHRPSETVHFCFQYPQLLPCASNRHLCHMKRQPSQDRSNICTRKFQDFLSLFKMLGFCCCFEGVFDFFLGVLFLLSIGSVCLIFLIAVVLFFVCLLVFFL